MKKIFLLLVMTTFALSCETDSTQDDLTNHNLKSDIVKRTVSEYKQLYDSIVALDVDDQMLVFSTLKPDERHLIWNIKLDNFISDNNLNDEQKLFVQELRESLKVEYFTDEDNQAKTDFINNKRDYFINKSKALFGDNEGRYFLTKIENINHAINKLPNRDEGSKGPLRACNCESSSECYRVTGVSWVGISWEYGNCGNGGCYVPVYNFLVFSCESDNTGRCAY